jgi:hypothetical protein
MKFGDEPGQPDKPVCKYHAVGNYDISAKTAREAHQEAMEKSRDKERLTQNDRRK